MNTTPRTTLSEHGIHVWRFPLVAARQEITALSHWLSERETARLNRMHPGANRDKRIVAWGRLRYILSRYLDCAPGDIQIARTKFGRPEIVFPEKAGIQFNLSHSGSFGLAGVSRNAVGVDIERVDASVRVERLAERFFAPGEAALLRGLPEEERIGVFFCLWVFKEAHLKLNGATVPPGLSRCEITFAEDGSHLCRSSFDSQVSNNVLVDIPVSKGYVAALACGQESTDISIFDL